MLALGPLGIGPFELLLILAVVVIIFGVGRLPEVGGAIGKSIREFRKSAREPEEQRQITEARSEISAPTAGASPTTAPAAGPTIACSQCGASNAAGSRFCSECGASLQGGVKCPQCGASNAGGAKFCSECGTSLQARVN